MAIPQLTLYRHDRHSRALITLAGEIDLTTEHLVHDGLGRCLRDGIRTIDVDLTTVTFCDVTGLNAFLHAARAIVVAGGSLRLHHPPQVLARIIALTGSGTLLLGLPSDLPASRAALRHVSDPGPPHQIASAAPAYPSVCGERAMRDRATAETQWP
ncbi:STAS domain-containing protein [Streptomyces sp. NPDC085866]|uniref:STAS domain-containing protein n=1 Tax=Streptomyces sp. NPDC085866 TaxID=3365736 RepID=UPI0037CE3123